MISPFTLEPRISLTFHLFRYELLSFQYFMVVAELGNEPLRT